jgi:hypothetical protein
VRVALRDASFSGSARFSEGRSQPTYVPVWHAISPGSPFLSRCGRLIDPTTETEHQAVISRCGAHGCRQAFASAAAESGAERGA